MADLRDEIADVFEAITGHAPEGLWSAPGVVALSADRSVAVNRRTVVALGARDDRVLRIASLADDELVGVPLDAVDADESAGEPDAAGWVSIAIGAIRGLGADLAAVPGADIVFDSTVPAVLGADAALAAALEVAFTEAWRLPAPPAAVEEAELDIVVVDTDDTQLAIDTLLGVGLDAPYALDGGVSAVIDAASVSRAQVEIDGAFAEHGLAQPEVLVLRSSAGPLRER